MMPTLGTPAVAPVAADAAASPGKALESTPTQAIMTEATMHRMLNLHKGMHVRVCLCEGTGACKRQGSHQNRPYRHTTTRVYPIPNVV
eukprot:m.213298 g.213298  ORF g.213298 m.213298 type:complete len:88 (+) comp26509_c0_seq1:1703-1966(+)